MEIIFLMGKLTISMVIFNSYLNYPMGTPGRESQCTVCLKHKSAWDAAHSGSQRSQCKLMQISMGRWVNTVFYFISFLLVFMAGKSGITLWTLHQSNHCFLLFCMFFFRNTMGRKFYAYSLIVKCHMVQHSVKPTPKRENPCNVYWES